MPRSKRWLNRSEEDRLRCRATETRAGIVRQCSEDRRTDHVHQWGGKAFSPGFSVPIAGGPTIGPSQLGGPR